jgi:hypothetical protein
VTDPSSPTDIREAGWMVAVHNDYYQAGVLHTFWLFSRGNFCVKGEGRTDAEALDEVRARINQADAKGAAFKTFEGVVKYTSEDGGKALVSDGIDETETCMEDGVFVRIQSWDGTARHAEALAMAEKRVRVTVEILE